MAVDTAIVAASSSRAERMVDDGPRAATKASSGRPDQNASEVNKRQEIAGKFLEAHRDPPETLQALEKTLDQVAFLVQM